MKGNLLSSKEIRKLENGTKVWIEDTDGEFEPSIHILKDDKFRDEADFWVYKDTNDIKVYEWLEEPESEQTITKTEKETNTYNKTYKGSEILRMIEEDKFEEDTVIQTTLGIEFVVESIIKGYITTDFLLNNMFTIKQKPVDFMTAVNSGKFIRPVSLNKQKDFQSYIYWLGFMVSGCAYFKEPKELINVLWEIEY